jgi:hypothetical protein
VTSHVPLIRILMVLKWYFRRLVEKSTKQFHTLCSARWWSHWRKSNPPTLLKIYSEPSPSTGMVHFLCICRLDRRSNYESSHALHNVENPNITDNTERRSHIYKQDAKWHVMREAGPWILVTGPISQRTLSAVLACFVVI